jgi:ubiquinone/menaquinone biosynthesis C-methylase UbiE
MAPKAEQAEERNYIPALRWKALTPAFDAVVRITARERAVKQRLLDQANVRPGQQAVLDLGAGTGTLAIWLKQRCPDARITGLDADPEVLAQARRKARDSHCEIDFVEGFSTELPFPDESFDVILSTLFFHHLTGADKRTTLAEVARVLKPEGQLHVADWGRPSDPAMAALFYSVRVIDGFEVTRDNVRGALPQLFLQAGLENAREHQRLRTALGTLSLYSARKPAIG